MDDRNDKVDGIRRAQLQAAKFYLFVGLMPGLFAPILAIRISARRSARFRHR